MARLEFTSMSGMNMDFIMSEDKSARQIVEYLNSEATVRSFGDTLRQVYPGEDLSRRLIKGLCRINTEDEGSVARKVRNWLNGKNVPKDRETLFQICFILDAGLEGTAKILGMAEENNIHYRNPRELVYAYALKMGKSYEQARELLLSTGAAGLIEGKGQENTLEAVFTEQIRADFETVDNDEMLAAFFRDNKEKFGRLHNTAFKVFDTLLARLKQPESMTGLEEEVYSVDDVVDVYFRMGMPMTKKTGSFSFCQRVVKKYWPGSRNIINIQNRREDVSRKVLILLALITELADELAGGDDEMYDILCGEDEESRLLRLVQEMNALLEDCGMSRLDPCCPFDFLVIYAMRGTEDGMSQRMEAVICQLFAEE